MVRINPAPRKSSRRTQKQNTVWNLTGITHQNNAAIVLAVAFAGGVLGDLQAGAVLVVGEPDPLGLGESIPLPVGYHSPLGFLLEIHARAHSQHPVADYR